MFSRIFVLILATISIIALCTASSACTTRIDRHGFVVSEDFPENQLREAERIGDQNAVIAYGEVIKILDSTKAVGPRKERAIFNIEKIYYGTISVGEIMIEHNSFNCLSGIHFINRGYIFGYIKDGRLSVKILKIYPSSKEAK